MEETTEFQQEHRQHAPVASSPECMESALESPEESPVLPNGKGSKRVSIACTSCKRAKRKCSGEHPCTTCKHLGRECVFDESLDQRRRVAARRTAAELDSCNRLFKDTLKVLGSGEFHGYKMMRLMKDWKPTDGSRIQYIAPYVRDALDTSGGRDADAISTNVGYFRYRIESSTRQPGGPEPMHLDYGHYRRYKPIDVPAQPWTRLSTDRMLLRHLVSIWFTWDYPLYSFLDGEVFLKYMWKENLDSEFCSAFLVNAMLAVACYYWDPTDTRGVFDDLTAQGDYFLVEAEHLKDSAPHKLTVGYLQGLLMLHEKYSLCGRNDLGYKVLHEAMETAQKMGLIGDGHPLAPVDSAEARQVSSTEEYLERRKGRLEERQWELVADKERMKEGENFSEEDLYVWGEKWRVLEEEKWQLKEEKMHWEERKRHLEEDRRVSWSRTAWGLFQIDAVVHTGFLRPSLITLVNIDKPDGKGDKQFWQDYPNKEEGFSRPSWFSEFSELSCSLSDIARDISRQVFGNVGAAPPPGDLQTRHALYERLFTWDAKLPIPFFMAQLPPPYVLLLRMRLHALSILVYLYNSEDEIWGQEASGMRTPESPDSPNPQSRPKNREEIIESAVRAIAQLANEFQVNHGLYYAHHSAMYAINLALFVMMNKRGYFSITDNDFLILSRCFFVITRRSSVGRSLFNRFRKDLHGKESTSRRQLGDEIIRLLDDGHHDEGEKELEEKLKSDDRYRVRGQKHPLTDMLDRYESLSLGKDDIARGRCYEQSDWKVFQY